MNILIIDDCPSRYEELYDIMYKNRDSFVLTCCPDLARIMLYSLKIDAILLDHDMPYKNGLEFVQIIADSDWRGPVIITSTTNTPNARENMKKELASNNISSIICPADHIHCEIEWYWYLKGFISKDTLR